MGGGVAASADVEETGGGVPRNRRTPWTKKRKEAKIVPGIGSKGGGENDVFVEPQ